MRYKDVHFRVTRIYLLWGANNFIHSGQKTPPRKIIIFWRQMRTGGTIYAIRKTRNRLISRFAFSALITQYRHVLNVSLHTIISIKWYCLSSYSFHKEASYQFVIQYPSLTDSIQPTSFNVHCLLELQISPDP